MQYTKSASHYRVA